MGPEFYQTQPGRKFFDSDFPRLVRALERLADVREEELKLKKEQEDRAAKT